MNEQSVNALLDAVRRRDAAAVTDLLDRDPELVRARGPAGETAVITAIYHRAPAVLEALVTRGARLDVFEAAAAGDAPHLRRLLAERPGLVSTHAPDGWTPLHLAAHFGHLDVVALLLEGGADVNARSRNDHANTALHAAAAGGAPQPLVARLLAAGADVDATQGGGYSALHEAAATGRRDLVTLLLDAGASATRTTDDGRTAAELARAYGHEAVIPLLDAGARAPERRA